MYRAAFPAQWVVTSSVSQSNNSPAFFTGCTDVLPLLTVDQFAASRAPVNIATSSGVLTLPSHADLVRLGVPPTILMVNKRGPVLPHYLPAVNYHHTPRRIPQLASLNHETKENLEESTSSIDNDLFPHSPTHSAAGTKTKKHSQAKAKLENTEALSLGKGVKRQLEFPSPSTSQLHPNGEIAESGPKRKPPNFSHHSLSHTNFSSIPQPPDLLNGGQWDKLSKAVWDHFVNSRQTDEMYRRKMDLRHAILSILQNKFPYCGLFVVGSSMNGLGSNSSDMDMCLMLTHGEIDQKNEAAHILKYILKEISKHSFVKKPQFIHAKVPILKFTDKISGVEVDLNINNAVGIRNTQLLNCYSRDGCTPPVLPCLQRVMKDKFLPNSDVRFLKLQEDIPHCESENHQTLGELLVGFLSYYSNKFAFSKEAISVRLGCTLPKHVVMKYKSPKNTQGQWKYICIEEPFDKTNTARAVYNEQAFSNILMVFRTSLEILEESKDLARLLNH
ncbi:poly(A) RNA polymerase GLD2-like isoform X3 [Tachypleus tridentatus]|uniref:poly(A) RNA polymerase GLD2-like isoform X3 n=1 Tax=Tachypleus tridentatus TaxID=6853 RepID=UPI003FD0AA45